ncbi:MAG: endonuclease [Sphingobacteriales bacterium]|nr:endonuclease [Sphingobacteriales bacterium]
MRLKIFTLLSALFLSVTVMFAQGTESFTNIPASNSSYLTRNWTGDNGLGWQATDARTDLTIVTGNPAIAIRNGAITCSNMPNGISSITLTHQQAFTGSGAVLEIRINGNLVGTINPTTTVTTTTVNGFNADGVFNLEIKQVTAGLRIVIDNISWTGSNNNPPCSEPTTQPTALSLTPTVTGVTGSFTAASPAADEYVVIRSTASSLSSQPVDGTDYSGGDIVGGGVVVSSGSSLNITETGLTANTTYYFFVYAYNNNSCIGGPNYLTASPLTAFTTTLTPAPCVAPSAPPTALNLTSSGNSVSGTFTASASANRYLTVISSAATLSSNPVNGITYTAGQSLGGGTVVSYSSDLSFAATGLSSNTTYYIYVFAASGDCSGEPFYNTTALTGNKATTNSGIPAGYYNAAAGLTCGALKTALYTIISSGTTAVSYSGLYNVFQITDKKRNDANTADVVWDIYSDNPTGPDPYTFTYGANECGNYSKEGDCFNREHSFPQSWFNSSSPMVSDAFHIYPTDGKVNGYHSNFPYGEVGTASITSLNGSKLGSSNTAGYSGTVFEPINEYKGDVARSTLYMVTRYENLVSGWQTNGNADNILNGTKYPALDDWELNLLIKWHNQDPVSQKEVDRNNGIYAFQNNRNPFIDHPEYVAAIWQCATGVTSLNVPDNFVRLYPNPVTTNTLGIQLQESFATAAQAQLIDLTGKIISTTNINAGIKNFSLSTNNLTNGRYFVKLITKKGITTRSFIVQK